MSRTQMAARSLALLISLFPFNALFAEEGSSTNMLPIATRGIEMPVEQSGIDPDRELQRLLTLYHDARATGTAVEADILAKQIIQLSIELHGRQSNDTAMALVNLANLQVANEENTAAIQNLTAAIDIIEDVDNNLSLQLIGPLNAMGVAQLQAGNTDLAQSAWQRAIHVSHVNYGPHNYIQIESLQEIGKVLYSMGKNKKAKKIRRRIAYLQQRETTLDINRLYAEPNR